MFPISHLYIAGQVLSALPMNEADAAAFLLGSIAPDAVQFRNGFDRQEKLVTHLCPKNGEAWGRVTANGWWVENIREFIKAHKRDPFALGYAAHILGDIFNNMYIWMPFILANPGQRALGYGNDYYVECGRVDTRLYHERVKDGEAARLLAKAMPMGMPGLVSAGEVNNIRDNVLYVSYPARVVESCEGHRYLTWEQLLHVTERAAEYISTMFGASPP